MRSRSGSTTSPPSTSAFIATPLRRAAIVLGHHEILRHVDQAAREVARVRRLQRRVGQALARAVRADEVLQHVQAFAEVRRDRRLDDRAVRLRHQAAHAGELPDLRRRAARAGVRHHEDRVERLLLDLLALAVGDFHRAELRPSSPWRSRRRRGPRCRPPCCSARPAVTRPEVYCASISFTSLLGFVDDRRLLRRDQHVVGGERDAAARGERVAGLHQLVGEDHRLAQAAAAEARVDDARDLLLLERLVDERERQARPAGSRTAARGRRWSRSA